MSYESGLSGSLRFHPSAASAAVCRRNFTLSCENRDRLVLFNFYLTPDFPLEIQRWLLINETVLAVVVLP
ncbi:hypothetical protein M0804_010488 [Polistes exclamans]|nr:hypothetical protein M0804_010488 [Polistes exclamans]